MSKSRVAVEERSSSSKVRKKRGYGKKIDKSPAKVSRIQKCASCYIVCSAIVDSKEKQAKI